MERFFEVMSSYNVVTILILATVIGSFAAGIYRGGNASYRQLLWFITDGLFTLISIFLSWKLAGWLSPLVREALLSAEIIIPQEKVGTLKQLYYTFVTAIRDFTLFRMGIVFLLGFFILQGIFRRLYFPLLSYSVKTPENQVKKALSTAAGGTVGILLGTGRALIIVLMLFIYVSFSPHDGVAGYIQQSQLYKAGAERVIEPVTGDFITQRVPVITENVENEFKQILKRKYEVIDGHIPEHIGEAAKKITAGLTTDAEKSRALYDWVGTRIEYDWEKVELYESRGIWREQTPEDTFSTRRGVCIDYSRLYVVMARAVGLEAKTVTGLGYNGRGGYGPHAWNEVFISETGKWIPLDATWAMSGDWYNPPHFYQTHIKDS
jgi:hypothetical protein